MKRHHDMPFGACRMDDGGARFRLWAPASAAVELVLTDAYQEPGCEGLSMVAQADGWFERVVAPAQLPPGTPVRYAFRLDGGLLVPDPASRCNPDDVHGTSELTDPLAFDWPDDHWRGRPWHEAVIYELHVGCFTPEGTFLAAIDRLDALVDLGVTAIELMPVADFPGRRGWGYDGVLLFAPDAAYGTPDDLKRLVAAAHALGLMVLLDVVYNHFGPDGNYLHAYAPAFFSPAVHTPWGAAIDLDGAASPTVRSFFIHNALYWIEEFHLDGLRVDAVHALHDTSPRHFIDELALAVRSGPGAARPVHLVLENDHNEAVRLQRDATGATVLANAQWNDDVHHAVHVLATGEADGYYGDYADVPLQRLGRALAEGFGYQGDPSAFRAGALRGSASTHLPPHAFVDSLQTHDQVGNRAFGERIAMLATAAGREDALRALVACVLLAPAVPMLFMGEEWAAGTPFLYFCDFTGELAQVVTRGRRAEFGRFERFADPAVRDRIPDPNDPVTFALSRLDWSERELAPHAHWLALYRALLQCRREHLVPWLAGARSGTWTRQGAGALRLAWPLAQGRVWHLQALLCDQVDAHLNERLDGGRDALLRLPGDIVYDSHPAARGAPAPWSVRVALESP